MDERTLLSELQALAQGKGLRDPDLSSRVRVNLRAALNVANAASSEELRARLTTLVNAIDDVADNHPPKQRDQMRRAIRGVLGLDDEVRGDSATERREHLMQLTGSSERTVRRWEKAAFLLLAKQLARQLNGRVATSQYQPDIDRSAVPASDEAAEACNDGDAHLPTASRTTTDSAIGLVDNKIRPVLAVYSTRHFYIINDRSLRKWVLWLSPFMVLMPVAYFAFLGGGILTDNMRFNDWMAEATSVDALPMSGSDASVVPDNGRLDVQWNLIGRPGEDAVFTEFVPGNRSAKLTQKLTQITGSFLIERIPDASCPDTTVAWSISTGSKVIDTGTTWKVIGGKVVASGLIGPSNPTQQLYVPIRGRLDTFTVSAHLKGAPCPAMGFSWRDPHIVIANRE